MFWYIVDCLFSESLLGRKKKLRFVYDHRDHEDYVNVEPYKANEEWMAVVGKNEDAEPLYNPININKVYSDQRSIFKHNLNAYRSHRLRSKWKKFSHTLFSCVLYYIISKLFMACFIYQTLFQEPLILDTRWRYRAETSIATKRITTSI